MESEGHSTSPLQTIQADEPSLKYVKEEPQVRKAAAPMKERPVSEVRQSKSHRDHKPEFQTSITQREADKMMYYHLNDRLLQQQVRKMTPQRYVQHEDHRGDLNTSRFGDNAKKRDQFLRDQYYKQKAENYRTIQHQEQDFDFLSGHSDSNSLSRLSPMQTRGRPSAISREVTDRDNQDSRSPFSDKSDHSRVTRFIYPKEHIEELNRQKSPLRRSASAQFLRNMIQGRNHNSFYDAPKMKGQVTANLIKFNQQLMKRDFEKAQKKRKEKKNTCPSLSRTYFVGFSVNYKTNEMCACVHIFTHPARTCLSSV